MVRMLISSAVYIIANAVGLLLATLLLSGFRIDFTGFVFATLLLSLTLAVLSPMITKMSQKNLPALQGGVALVTTFAGLGITSAILPGMGMQGLATWLAATLLVWLGALAANIALPMFVFKKYLANQKTK